MIEEDKIFAVIDAETTGRNHRVHDMIQICILPLDSDLNPIKEDVFYYQIKADRPENTDPKALEICQLDPLQGIDKEEALRLFTHWNLSLANKYKVKKIIPIGQNYSFDKEFMTNFLGFEFYDLIFDYNYRDTKQNGAYLSDSVLPGFKSSLAKQAEYFEIDNSNHHDALNDCLVTAEIYKAQLKLINSLTKT